MLHSIQDYVKSKLPNHRYSPTSGWTSFNAICCHHHGETQDKRSRGGVKFNTNGSLSYHCFNCGFKASYIPGRTLSFKFRNFLKWLGAPDNDIQMLVLTALRVRDLVDPDDIEAHTDIEVSFSEKELPEGARLLSEWAIDNQQSEMVVPALEYLLRRNVDIDTYKIHWTPTEDYNLNRRIIIPFFYGGKIIGYTSRGISATVLPKYHADVPPGYVYNLDRQTPARKVVVVVEGVFDAMAIDGVAVLGSECSSVQADLIESLGKEVIVVPDFDVEVKKNKKIWKGYDLVKVALEHDWAVSFPVWSEQCKDASEACDKYGKLFVLKAILDAAETNKTKIQLLTKGIMRR